MERYADALDSIFQIQEFKLRMSGDQVFLVVKHRLQKLIDSVFADIVGSDQRCADGNRGGILVNSVIGAGRDHGLGIEIIVALQLLDMLLIELYQADILCGSQVDNRSGRSSGNDEGSVNLAVLQAVRGITKGSVYDIDVIKAQVIGIQVLLRVELDSRTGVADGNGLALQIRNTLDRAVAGDDLDGLVIQSGYGGEGLIRALILEQVGAGIGLVHNVVLNDRQIRLSHVNKLDIRLGRAGGCDCQARLLQNRIQHGRHDSADRIVSPGRSAGSKCQAVSGHRGCRNPQYHTRSHHDTKNTLFHSYTSIKHGC